MHPWKWRICCFVLTHTHTHTLLIKVFSGGMSLLFIKKELGEFCFSTFYFYTLGVRKETNLPLEVPEMFIGLVTLLLVR